MSAPAESTSRWEPFTPRGVAAFAARGFGRLLLVQFIVALLAAGAVVWFVDNIGFPAVTAAIQKLPPAGEIRSGKLDWPGRSPELLADRSYPDAGRGPGSLRPNRPDRRRANRIWQGNHPLFFAARLLGMAIIRVITSSPSIATPWSRCGAPGRWKSSSWSGWRRSLAAC